MASSRRATLGLLAVLPLFAAHRIPVAQPTPITRLHVPPVIFSIRGGDATITVRVRTADGMKRVTVPADATLMDLQKVMQKDYKMAVARQRLSKDKKPFGDDDGGKSFGELGIEHGALLQLDLAPAAAPGADGAKSSVAPPPPPPPSGARGGRRRRSQTMADFEAKRSEYEIVLETPGAAVCQYLSVDADAGKEFSDFVLDNEFEERRIALLYGRWVDEEASGGKRGVLVDVIYEPPQVCTGALTQPSTLTLTLTLTLRLTLTMGIEC